MKTWIALLTAIWMMVLNPFAQVLPTFGEYDEGSQTNSVDFVADGTNLDFEQFKSDLSLGYSAGRSGVFQFEILSGSSGPYNLGLLGNRQLLVTGPDDPPNYLGGTGNDQIVRPISKSASGVSLSPQITFIMRSVDAREHPWATWNPVDEHVTKVGISVLSTSWTNGLVVATAQLSGGDELRAVREINEPPGAGDTFFGFQAPAGQFILSLQITNTSGNWIYLDDFAFVIEPFAFLRLLRANGQVRLTWPTNYAQFELRTSSAMLPADWLSVTNPIIVNGDRVETVLEPPQQDAFYQLFKR